MEMMHGPSRWVEELAAAARDAEVPSWVAAVPGRVLVHCSGESLDEYVKVPDGPGRYQVGTGRTHHPLLPLRPGVADSPRHEQRARHGTFGTPRIQREG